jgi:hypothetical protein
MPHEETPCSQAEKIEIIRGESRTFSLKFVLKSNGDPYDLTGTTALKVQFPKDPTGSVDKTIGSGVTITSAVAGKITVTLDIADTVLLKVGEDQTIEAEITQPSGVRKVHFIEVLDVVADLFT